MACTNLPEWSIEFKSFPTQHGLRATNATLRFCLDLHTEEATAVVTGEVQNRDTNQHIADVNGFRTPSGVTGIDFLRLSFDWAPAQVVVVGLLFSSNGTVLNRFHGRYLTTAPSPPASSSSAQPLALASPIGPDTGDTGTSTGQTT